MSYHKDNIYDLTIIKGKREGVYKTYYDTEGSKLWKEGEYKDDTPSGLWTEYNEDGTIRRTMKYFDDWTEKHLMRYGRKDEYGFVEKLTWYFPNGKIVEFNIPFDDNVNYQKDCGNKYIYQLQKEERRIKDGEEPLWEDNKWNIDRGRSEEFNNVKHDVEEGEIILIKKGRD